MIKKSSKPNLDKEIIGPHTRTIKIEHVLGKQTLIQKLTVPRRRPFKNVFQFKCTLLHTKPPVWRRIQVPESYTFYELHVAVQDAMDWLDYHLHHFEVMAKSKKEKESISNAPGGIHGTWMTIGLSQPKFPSRIISRNPPTGPSTAMTTVTAGRWVSALRKFFLKLRIPSTLYVLTANLPPLLRTVVEFPAIINVSRLLKPQMS